MTKLTVEELSYLTIKERKIQTMKHKQNKLLRCKLRFHGVSISIVSQQV